MTLRAISNTVGTQSFGPFGLNPSTVKQAAVKALASSSTTAFDLINISGSGYINSFKLIAGNTDGNSAHDGVNLRTSTVNIFIDGEGSPSITFNCNDFLSRYHGGSGSPPQSVWMKKIGLEFHNSGFNALVGFLFRYPIPFKSSFRMQIVPAQSYATNWFINAEWVSGVIIPLKLFSTVSRGTIYTALQCKNGSVQFLNLAAGNSGWIAHFGFTFDNTNSTSGGSSFTASMSTTVMTVTGTVTGLPLFVGQVITGAGVTANTTITSFGTGSGGAGTYNINNSQTVVSEAMTGGASFDEGVLELEPSVYLDGKTPSTYNSGTGLMTGNLPDYGCSGFEDFFRSSFYFLADGTGSWTSTNLLLSDFYFVSSSGLGYRSAHMSLLDLNGGIKFNNGVLFRLQIDQVQTNAPTHDDTTLDWFVLYYQPA